MIIKEKNKTERTFGDIKSGDVFKYGDGNYYIKTDEEKWNAVNIETGAIATFDTCHNIKLIKNSKLVVKV